MSMISILHLSDIHFENKKKVVLKSQKKYFQEKMVKKIREHIDKHSLDLDFVAVTGDIAYSGKEYNEAEVFFAKLKNKLSKQTKILMVPGNHDVNRKKIKKVFSLHDRVQKGLTDEVLDDDENIQFFISEKFKSYMKFVKKLNLNLYKKNSYFWVENFEQKDVSFLGLNSCWASENENDRNNITLGFPQVSKAFEEAECSNKILLMHHPIFNWLNEDDLNKYRGEIFKKCSLILHGHTHADSAFVVKSPIHSCICLGANASYIKDNEGYIGFQFIKANFQGKGVSIRVWPYKLEIRDGNIEFKLDRSRWGDVQKGNDYFDLDTF